MTRLPNPMESQDANPIAEAENQAESEVSSGGLDPVAIFPRLHQGDDQEDSDDLADSEEPIGGQLPESLSAGSLLESLERRQDQVLLQLDELHERVETVLKSLLTQRAAIDANPSGAVAAEAASSKVS